MDNLDDYTAIRTRAIEFHNSGRYAEACEQYQRVSLLWVRRADPEILAATEPLPGREDEWLQWWGAHVGTQCSIASVQTDLYLARAAALTLQPVERMVPYLAEHRRVLYYMTRARALDHLAVAAFDREEAMLAEAADDLSVARAVYEIPDDPGEEWATDLEDDLLHQALYYGSGIDYRHSALLLLPAERDLSAARAYLGRAFELFERLEEAAPEIAARMHAGLSAYHGTDAFLTYLEGDGSPEAIDEAEHIVRENVLLGERDPASMLNRPQAWRALAVLACMRGDEDEAYEYAEFSEEAAAEIGHEPQRWAALQIRRLIPEALGHYRGETAERALHTLGGFVDVAAREIMRRDWLSVLEQAAVHTRERYAHGEF